MMELVLVSACLVGVKCRYSGENVPCAMLEKQFEQGLLVPMCPEMLGGLPAPRLPCELQTDAAGNLIVVTKNGNDVTAEFTMGAEMTVAAAMALGIKRAVMKSKSPSCGCGVIYDGTFSGQLVAGNGLTVQKLIVAGIVVVDENEWMEEKS